MTSHFALLSIDAKNRNANNISEMGSFGSMLPIVPILRLPGLHGENR